MGDILNSLFDDDNEDLTRVEALAKGLVSVDVNELLQTGQEVSGGLLAMNKRR